MGLDTSIVVHSDSTGCIDQQTIYQATSSLLSNGEREFQCGLGVLLLDLLGEHYTSTDPDMPPILADSALSVVEAARIAVHACEKVIFDKYIEDR